MSKSKHNQMRDISAPRPSQPAAPAVPANQPKSTSNATASSTAVVPKTAPLPAQMAVGSGKSSNHPTLEQQRAAHALNRVRTVENAPNVSEKQKSRYRSYVESLPATIVMNGLGQACATLLASSNGADDDSNGDGKSRARAYRDLHKHLEDWLCRDDDGVYRGQKPLIDAIVSRGQSEYVHAQAEALAYLVWLKKFSQAFLPRGDRD